LPHRDHHPVAARGSGLSKESKYSVPFPLCRIAIGALGAAMPTLAADPADAPRVLLVVSSHGRDDVQLQPYFELDELAQA